MTKRFLDLQVRAAPDKGEGVVEAYASVFDVDYRVGYGLKETIKPGAFAESIKDRSIPIYHEHSWRNGDEPIGVTRAVAEDETGLRVEAELFVDTSPKARNVYRAMEARALNEWSIGFVPTEETTVTRENGDEVIEVTKGDLLEASTVLRGANPETDTVGVRAEFDEDAEPEPKERDCSCQDDPAEDDAEERAIALDVSNDFHREVLRGRFSSGA